MLTLHKAIDETKVLLKWGAISVAAIFLLIVLIRTAINIKEHFFPTPPPSPTVSFGKLPQISFPKNAVEDTFAYTLDTISGTLPIFSDRATIYKTTSPKPNLLALERAKQLVSKAGFSEQPVPLSETVYQWTSQDSFKKILTYNILSSNFSLVSQYLSDPSVLNAKNSLSAESATDRAKSFLSSISSFPSDIDTQKTTTQLQRIQNGELSQATSLSNTQAIRIDFFQKDVEQLPVFYPFPPYSVMNLLVTNSTFEPQIVEAHFYHQSIDTISATYPIKTAEDAFLDLKNHQAYIASYFGTNKDIRIHDVLLGYLFQDQQQDYLMPIIVFEGDNGFYAYVSAVKDSWINK